MISVTKFNAAQAYKVIPDQVEVGAVSGHLCPACGTSPTSARGIARGFGAGLEFNCGRSGPAYAVACANIVVCGDPALEPVCIAAARRLLERGAEKSLICAIPIQAQAAVSGACPARGICSAADR